MLKICAKLWILIFYDLCRARLTWRKAMLQHRPVLLTLTMDSSCLSSLSFLWLLCTLQDTSKYSKLVQEDRMITIEDGRKVAPGITSLWKQRCVPSEQESNLRYAGAALILLVGIYKPPGCLKTMAVVSSLETKCISWQPTATAQIFRVPKKSTTLNIFQPCSTERYTTSKISEWESMRQICYSHGDLCTLGRYVGMCSAGVFNYSTIAANAAGAWAVFETGRQSLWGAFGLVRWRSQRCGCEIGWKPGKPLGKWKREIR